MPEIPEDLVATPMCLDAIVRARAERAAGAKALGGLAPAEFESGLAWDEFATLAGRAAAYLEEREIGRGDRVAIWGQTSLAWAVWLVASAWRGAALVAVHPNLGKDDLIDTLIQSRPSWLIADETARGIRLAEDAREAGDAARLRGVTVMLGGDGRFDLDGVLDERARPPTPRGAPDAPLCIQFTSGSTGRPKAVVLSHRALVGNAALTAKATGIGAGDRIAAPLPLFHSAGLSTGLILSVVVDALWVGFHRYQTKAVLDGIDRLACTVVQGVPTIYTTLLDRMAETSTGTPSLRIGIIGGAYLPPDLCARAVDEMELEHIGLVYGQTEFAPTVAVTRGDEPPDLAYTTAGPPLPGVSVRIVDPETGARLPDGEVGEIVVEGPTMMSGYFDDPAATNATITPDGGLRTGDLGRLVSGCLRVTARLKELIIRGGENVSPYQVEAGLNGAPGVAEVCVVPTPSAHWGEEICAVLVARAANSVDIDAVRAYAASRLPRYMRPDRYLIIESLPLLANGKVDRRAVQRAAGAEDTP